MAIQNTQAIVSMNARSLGKTQIEAAARAGISESTARRIESGQHPSQQQPQSRDYKTRNDPLSDVWESDLVPMLEQQPDLLPITLFEYLQDTYPGEYEKSHRTLQRRIKQWHALHGEAREIIFRQ